ncbi:MAG: PAS domain S-box protein [Bacteroidales bacterium]
MEYTLDQILDVPLLQALQDKLNAINPFPSALIDNSGKILTATAWQDICTKFHRINPESEKECIKSDQYILSHLHEANPAVTYKCPHGMVDNAVPIVIEGHHLASFFTGQLFLEPPDHDFFRKQAARYGFDEEAYLEAVKKVPVWNKEQLHHYLDFIKTFTESLASMGLTRLREIETNRLATESENRYQSLVEQASDGIFISDQDGNYTDVNTRGCEMFGYTREEILKLSMKDLLTQEEVEKQPLRIEELKQGKIILSERRMIRQDGSTLPVEISGKMLTSGHLQDIVRDITLRKEAEENMRNLAHAIDCINECVSMTDADDTIIFVNKAFCNTYGYSPDELLGRNIIMVRSPAEPRNKTSEILDDTLGGGWSGEVMNRRKDGTDFPVHLSTAIVTDSNDQPVALIGIAVDITERKKNEEELIAAKEKAEESDRLKSAYLANISHEIRTPMNSILGFSELLEDIVDDPKQLEYLRIISNGGERLLNIINSVIDIAKIEAGQENLSSIVFDINPLMQELFELNKRRNTRIEFINDTVTSPPFILFTDKTKLFQILNNLLSNALKFTRQGTVRFGYSKSSENITFYVKDTGLGIPAEFKSKVFERFRKVDLHDRTDFEGTGLGLAITKELLKMLKGEIWFESEPGQGTTFFVRFPV